MAIRDSIKIAKFEKKWISLMANLGLYRSEEHTSELQSQR